jgi:hypothetical protein
MSDESVTACEPAALLSWGAGRHAVNMLGVGWIC